MVSGNVFRGGVQVILEAVIDHAFGRLGWTLALATSQQHIVDVYKRQAKKGSTKPTPNPTPKPDEEKPEDQIGL